MNIRPMGTPADWADSQLEWATTHQRISEAELDRFIAEMHPPGQVLPFGGCDCSLALPECQCCCRPTPRAEACTDIGAHTEPPRVVDTLRRRRSITAVLFVALGAAICAVSVVGYLRVPT